MSALLPQPVTAASIPCRKGANQHGSLVLADHGAWFFFQGLRSSPGPSGSRLRWGSLAVTGSHEVGGKHHSLGFHKVLFALHTTLCERMHLMGFLPSFFLPLQ